MTARKILNDRRTAEREALAIQRQIEKTLPFGGPKVCGTGKRAEKVPGADEYIAPLPGTNCPEGAAYQHVEGYEEKLRSLLAEKQELYLQAEEIIEALDDGNAREILRYYYCLAWTDESISAELNYDRAGVCKRRNAAVDWLDVNWHKKT